MEESNSSSESDVVIEISAANLLGEKGVATLLTSFVNMRKQIDEQKFLEGKNIEDYVAKLILTKKEGE